MSDVWESCISVALTACLDVLAGVCIDFASIREFLNGWVCALRVNLT